MQTLTLAMFNTDTVLVLIGATRQHFALDSNTHAQVNILLTHRFSFMCPPAAVERRLIFI